MTPEGTLSGFPTPQSIGALIPRHGPAWLEGRHRAVSRGGGGIHRTAALSRPLRSKRKRKRPVVRTWPTPSEQSQMVPLQQQSAHSPFYKENLPCEIIVPTERKHGRMKFSANAAWDCRKPQDGRR